MSIAYLVDDDAAMRDALSWLLRSRGIESRVWDSAEAFLTDYRADMSGCLVLDIRMQAMTGLELFDHLLARDCRMPVIFLTGHGDVPMAVKTLKKGAFDFLEKPFDDNELADRIIEALALDEQRRLRGASASQVQRRVDNLTAREREVMQGIVVGKLNKVIAGELNISMRTVEVHRAHIFEKMQVRSAVELAQMLGLLDER
ncbi:MAG: response regulator transcription factor [Betaproteobacteria bacterium]|nr:response regulator transcription factor [Betaproteobacteria bacterium]